MEDEDEDRVGGGEVVPSMEALLMEYRPPLAIILLVVVAVAEGASTAAGASRAHEDVEVEDSKGDMATRGPW